MSITPADFIVSFSPNPVSVVVGMTGTANMSFSNISAIDWGYNLTLEVTLPDGVSFVSSTVAPTLITTNPSGTITLGWTSLKDLAPNEINYRIGLTLHADETFRLTGNPVPFDVPLISVNLSATVDTLPRGNDDPGNVKVTNTTDANFIPLRYNLVKSAPGKMPKGAGLLSPVVAPKWPYQYTLTLMNNSRVPSTVTLLDNLPNGVRYLGGLSVSGPDGLALSTPIVITPSPGLECQNFVSLDWGTVTLSAPSLNVITFNAAIWDNYTMGCVENSGSRITHLTPLQNTAALNGLSGPITSNSITNAMDATISKNVAPTITDVGQINQYTLSYRINQYDPVNSFTVTDLLSNGQSYVTGSAVPPYTSLTNNMDGSTTIFWDLGLQPNGTTGTIKFSSLVDPNYIPLGQVSAGDILTNHVDINGSNQNFSTPTPDNAGATLSIPIPVISKSVLNYYYSDGSPKPFNVLAPGDLAEFMITYSSLGLTAQQRTIEIDEYAPTNMGPLTAALPVTYGGTLGTSFTPITVSPNGLRWPLGTVPGNSLWIATFQVPVISAAPVFIGQQNNLAKLAGTDTAGFAYSDRDQVPLTFGEPNVDFSKNVSGPNVNAIKSGETYTYSLTISNPQNTAGTVTDAFQMDLTDLAPIDLIPTGAYSITGTGSHTTPSFVGQNVSLTVTQLAPDQSLVFSYDVLVSPSVVSGKSYTNQAILQQPYSQIDRSFQYPGSPFTGQTTLKALGITLTKLISPTFAKIGDVVTYILQATIPQGTTAYQVQVSDNYPSAKQTYIAGSGIPVPASVVPGTVTFPTIPFVDATAAAVTLLYQFQVRVTNASLSSPYREDQTDSATVKWDLDNSGTHATPFTTTANLQVRVPRLTARKEQRNVTQSGIYGTGNVNYNIGDTISYRITLSNLGPAEAFNVQFTDTLDPLLSFDIGSITTTSGSASFAAGVISWTIPQINVSPGSATLIFTVTTLPGVPADGRIPDFGTISSYNTNNNGFGISLGPVNTNTVQLVSPAVTINKTSSLAAGEIGDDITYTLTITVPNGTIAYAPNVDDTLPVGQTYIGPAYRQELPNPAVLVSNIGSGLNVLFPINPDIDASAGAKTIIYTFVARITSATHNPPYSEIQTNTGRVRWLLSPGGTVRGATKTLPITVRTPHITILKEQSLDGISYTTANLSGLPGDTIYYRLTINSDGASPAFNINQSDALSTRITFQSITSGPTAGNIVFPLPGPGPNGTLNWNIPQLNVGSTGILAYSVVINSGIGAGDSFSNTATASYDSNDVNPITYTQNANKVTLLIPALGFTKSVSTLVAAIGDTLTYTLTINIPSGVLAYNLVIVDELPMGQQYVPGSWSPLPAPVVVGNQITFTNPVTPETGPLTLVYTFQSLVISGQTAPPYTETQQNSACISWGITSSGPTAPRVCSFVDVEITSPHMVSLKEQRNASIPGSQFTTDPIPGVTIGDTVEYRITLTNDGLNTAYTNVTTDVLDSNITYTGLYSLSPAGGTVVSSVAPGNPDGILTWTQTTPIPAGGTAVLVFSVMQTTGSAPGTTVLDNASTIYKSNPANPGNLGPALSNTVGFAFSPPAITKTVDHPNVFVGDTLTYTVSITIPKGNIAYDVQVSDILPLTQSYIPDSLTRNTVPIIPSPTLSFPMEGTINATLAAVTIIYTFQATVDSIASPPQEIQTDIASITYNLAEGGPAGPQQNAYADVFVTNASITLVKAQRNFTTNGVGPFTQTPPIQVSVGDVVHYQLTVGNPSLSNTLYHVNVFDVLGSLLQYMGPLNPPPVGVITESGGTVNWTIDSIPPNTSYNAIIVVTILPGGGSGDTIPDTLDATFAVTNIPPVIIYGPLTSNTVLAQLSSLKLQKTVDSTVAVLGQFLTYTLTLTVPNGTIAYNVVVTDTLPNQQLYGNSATKNGIEITPTVTGQVITFPSEPILDASTGDLVITYKFLSHIVMANDSSPYTEIQTNNAQVNWDIDPFGTPATPTNADQDVVVNRPFVVLEKLQRNVTQGTGFVATPITVEVGDTVRFSLKVYNTGASTAYNVVVSDHLDPFDQFAGINTVTAGTAIYDTITSTIIWTIATIPPGGSEQLLFDITVLPGVSAGDRNTNTATTFYDTDPTTPITIGPVDSNTVYQEYPNVLISKTANVTNTVVGAVITYTVGFTLPNGTIAYNAQFTDILPVGQQYNNNAKLNGLPITPAEVNGQFIAFPIVPYASAVGGAQTYIYQFDVIVISAAVDPFTFIAVQTNNAMGNWYLDPGTPAPPVDALVDIHVTDGIFTITKEQRNASSGEAFTTLPISGKMGQIIEYRLTIFNPSPRVLYDIIIEDLLSSHLAFNTVVSLSVGTLTHSGEPANGTVTWSLGTLIPNDTAIAIFSVKILSNKTTIVTNNAQGTFLINPANPNRFGTIISNTVITNITSPPRGISLMNWEDQLDIIEFSNE